MVDKEAGQAANDFVADPRKAAIKRIKAKRDFQTHLFVYVAINLFLVGIWAVSSRGFFWPIFVMLGWGIGVAVNAWNVYGAKPITEDDVQRELEKNGPVVDEHADNDD